MAVMAVYAEVADNWKISKIDDSNSTKSISVAIDSKSGKPYISYYDGTDNKLMMAHPSANGNCGPNNDWLCEAQGDGGKYSSIDICTKDGETKVGIAYFGYSSLKYFTYTCNADFCIKKSDTIDQNSTYKSIGKYPSLKIDSACKGNIGYFAEKF